MVLEVNVVATTLLVYLLAHKTLEADDVSSLVVDELLAVLQPPLPIGHKLLPLDTVRGLNTCR